MVRPARHALLAASLLLFGCDLQESRVPAPRTEVLFPDVGQGQATVVASGGRCVMIDAGPPDPAPDWIARLPCTALEAVLVTHWDLDHRGGLDSVFARLPVGTLLHGKPPEEDSVRVRMDGFCRRSAHGCASVAAGQSLPFLEGTSWSVLHVGTDSVAEGNATSVVTRLSSPDGSLLVAGDLDSSGEQVLAATLGPARLRSDLLLLPHHGSAGSNSLAWLGAVRPRLAVAQAGRGNRYGHPAPSVLGRLEALAIPTWVTADLGGLRLPLDASSRSPF